MAELSVHVVTTFPWQAVMFYFNSHISPLRFPLTGWDFTRIPRGCHFIGACRCYPSSGNSPLHTSYKNMLHPMAKTTEKNMVLADTVLGFSTSPWVRKGQACRGWILTVSWTHTSDFSREVIKEEEFPLGPGWHSRTSQTLCVGAGGRDGHTRFITHDAGIQSWHPY